MVVMGLLSKDSLKTAMNLLMMMICMMNIPSGMIGYRDRMLARSVDTVPLSRRRFITNARENGD